MDKLELNSSEVQIKSVLTLCIASRSALAQKKHHRRRGTAPNKQLLCQPNNGQPTVKLSRVTKRQNGAHAWLRNYRLAGPFVNLRARLDSKAGRLGRTVLMPCRASEPLKAKGATGCRPHGPDHHRSAREVTVGGNGLRF